MSIKHCAYCGRIVNRREKEHVVMRTLFADSRRDSKVQLITVPTCRACNEEFSDDEAHFRNVIVVAGEANAAATELWRGPIRRSFVEIDGFRRFSELTDQLIPRDENGAPRLTIFPANDPRILRIIKKIVRGLCHKHGIVTAVPEAQVWADVHRYRLPNILADKASEHHIHRDIFEYGYEQFDVDGLNSFWMMTFFGRTRFIAAVFTSAEAAEGFASETGQVLSPMRTQLPHDT